jgi:hypothetical protein
MHRLLKVQITSEQPAQACFKEVGGVSTPEEMFHAMLHIVHFWRRTVRAVLLNVHDTARAG